MGKRLIDADKLYEALYNEGGCGAEDNTWDKGWDDAFERAEDLVTAAPTVIFALDKTLEMQHVIMQRAIDRYGIQAQSDQCVQEMAELTQAIMKARQLACASHLKQTAALDNLIEEIADVEIMIDQMRMIYGAASVDAVRERKLARLEERLEKLDREGLT